MRLIRPRPIVSSRAGAIGRALAMIVVGAVALAMLVGAPRSQPTALAALALAALLGLGIGGVSLVRCFGRPARARLLDELSRLLAVTFDDAYALIVEPHLPEVSDDLAALLVGPGGVRALVVRGWDGHYRVTGRKWEYDARGNRGWINCRTNPSFDAQAVADAVARWAREHDVDPKLPIAAAIAFPQRHSRVALQEPDEEVVTWENAPWWAQRIGRVQRLDAPRVARVVESVMEASERAARRGAARAARTVSE